MTPTDLLNAVKMRLRTAAVFPSPPGVAMRLIELAGDPDINMGEVAALISKDPGLSAKLLRVANSPLYCKRRRSENIRQALVSLGLNAATTLALSFSLLRNYPAAPQAGVDYQRFWRRAILSSSAARLLAEQAGGAGDDIFLAALLQDVAVLAIDRAHPGFYADLPLEAPHTSLSAHEQQRLGADHADLGAWLMRQWKLPESLCRVIEISHGDCPAGSPLALAHRCLQLGSECADTILADPAHRDMSTLMCAGGRVGVAEAELGLVIETLLREIPEIEQLFDTTLMDGEMAAAILDEARELLSLRSVHAMQELSTLRETAEQLQERSADLEERSRRDPLTGLFNRGYLDVVLEREFRSAREGGWPLSVIFADLDRFKHVNDTFGHGAGDQVLKQAASDLLEATRDSDVVARYGGEEFLILLPGVAGDIASMVCERILKRMRAATHDFPNGRLHVTVSLGLATLSSSSSFDTPAALIHAADVCVYEAKRSGRDRMIVHGDGLLRSCMAS